MQDATANKGRETMTSTTQNRDAINAIMDGEYASIMIYRHHQGVAENVASGLVNGDCSISQCEADIGDDVYGAIELELCGEGADGVVEIGGETYSWTIMVPNDMAN